MIYVKNLPVEPAYTRVLDTYVSDRNMMIAGHRGEISVGPGYDLFDLPAFTRRWRAVWDKHWEQFYPQRAECELRDGTFDLSVTIECLLNLTSGPEGACRHMNDSPGPRPEGSCTGMHIMAPLAFIEASRIARHFGVPWDVALLQANGGYGRCQEPDWVIPPYEKSPLGWGL